MSKQGSARAGAPVGPNYDIIVVDDTETEEKTVGGIKYTHAGQTGADVYKTVVLYFYVNKDDRAYFDGVRPDGAVHLMIGGDKPTDLPVFKRWVKEYVENEMPDLYRRVRREYSWALRAEARARALKRTKEVALPVDAKSVWGEMEVKTIYYILPPRATTDQSNSSIFHAMGLRFHTGHHQGGPTLVGASVAPLDQSNSIVVRFEVGGGPWQGHSKLPFNHFTVFINSLMDSKLSDHPNESFITVGADGVVDVLVESVLAVRRAELWFKAGKVAPNHLPRGAGVKDVAHALLEAGVVPPLH